TDNETDSRLRARPRSCGTCREATPPPGPSFFRLIEIDRASERRRPTPVGDRRLAASGRERATDRKGGAVALIRARTRKSLKPCPLSGKPDVEPTSPNDRV